ncbi:MAG: phospho-N-acetylmuramoyl-pentapeptide-transferase [Blastocatellia bacterium]|nr:phospho-N-acetylmuramoyl-pentapeptide-transferase [Blastocatellia bacterium]
MLYYLLYDVLRQLNPNFGPLRVFEYVSFRAVLAAITSMVISLALGPFMIEKLRVLKFGQEIREEGVRAHQAKRGTPTMGGVLMIVSIGMSTLLWSNLAEKYVWIVFFCLIFHGLIGFLDDYIKIKQKRNLGLTSKQKLVGQLVTALVLGLAIIFWGGYSTRLSVPFFKDFSPNIGWIPYLGFMIFLMVGYSNAVNLTDGLDGLASSTTFVVTSALGGLTFVTGFTAGAIYLGLSPNPAVWEVTIFCAAMAGACLGFLWFNAHPAEVFMGDVGSLALGGSIGCVAILIKQELLLTMLGGIYVIETLSVILQTSYYKMTKDPVTKIGKRIFKMTPIHHHFEELGWKETKIVFRFLILQFLFVLLGLATLKLR